MFYAIKSDGLSAISAGNENRENQEENDAELVKKISLRKGETANVMLITVKDSDTYQNDIMTEAMGYDVFPAEVHLFVYSGEDNAEKDALEKEIRSKNIDYVVVYQVTDQFAVRNKSWAGNALQSVVRSFSIGQKPLLYKVYRDHIGLVME